MFAFLHFYDPHSDVTTEGPKYPYDSGDDYVARFAGAPPEDFTGCTRNRPVPVCNSQWLRIVSTGEEQLSEEHARFLSGLYDAGVRKMDDDLRRFFEELERRGALDDALVVITSDHGEDLYEHGTLLHGTFYEEIMHVPLIVLPPAGVELARKRISEVSRSIDIAPTILELVGLPGIGQGQSLTPALLRGEQVVDHETFFSPAVLRGIDDQGTFKVFAYPSAPVFYDLDADPEETTNFFEHEELLLANEERVLRAEARVQELRNESYALQRSLKPTQGEVEVTPEVAAALEELGYTDSGDDDEQE
jgi:arylsulfatase A-like enzyme